MAAQDDGLSRRAFLTLSGVAPAAALLVPSREAQAAVEPRVLGPAPVAVQLLINGRRERLRVEPRTTLASLLRDVLGLTGTKIGCDRGACGACTVWVERQPAPACMLLALDVAAVLPGDEPRAVTTIEGLSARGALHPVQRAFIEEDALQCGFCTPGMVMSCAALCERAWARGTVPGEGEVREAVAGNLCRCGAYPNIIAATLRAAAAGRDR